MKKLTLVKCLIRLDLHLSHYYAFADKKSMPEPMEILIIYFEYKFGVLT